MLPSSIESFDSWSSGGKQRSIVKHILLFQTLQSTNVKNSSLNAFTLKSLPWPKIIQNSVWLNLDSHHCSYSITTPLSTDQQGMCQQLFAYYTAWRLCDVCEHLHSITKYFFTVNLNPLTFTKLCSIKQFLVYALSFNFSSFMPGNATQTFLGHLWISFLTLSAPFWVALQKQSKLPSQGANTSSERKTPKSLSLFKITVLSHHRAPN